MLCLQVFRMYPSHSLIVPQSLATFNADASLLATASTKGTVIRVHRLPQVGIGNLGR